MNLQDCRKTFLRLARYASVMAATRKPYGVCAFIVRSSYEFDPRGGYKYKRRMFGQYYTLFQELDRESEGDYMNYMRMSRNMFAELLIQVAPRITKSSRQVQHLFAVLNYDCIVQNDYATS